MKNGAPCVVIVSRVTGSRDGGTTYGRAIVAQLLEAGAHINLVAERSEAAQLESPPLRVSLTLLSRFFQTGVRHWLDRLLDLPRLLQRLLAPENDLIIVQGDLPRLTYLWVQFFVPLLFIRQDGILTCPANTRFLPASRKICDRGVGFSCLSVNRSQGCLQHLSGLPRLGRIIYRMRDMMMIRGFRHFAVNSNYLGQVHGRPAAVLYPPNLDRESSSQAASRNLKQLIFCGRLDEPCKGAQDAIDILSHLPKDFRLTLLGGGERLHSLGQYAASQGVGDRVEFAGWVEHDERDRRLAESGVLLVPSLLNEAFGLVGIEAFSQGTPAVAYDVGGIAEWCLPEAGILVPCGDTKAAAEAVLHMTQNTADWLKYSQSARSLVLERFPASRFGRDLRKLVESSTGIQLR